MALLKRTRMKKETARKKQYLEHFRKAKASALTYAQWMKKGGSLGYVRGGAKSPATILREAKAKPFKRKVEDILKLKRKRR